MEKVLITADNIQSAKEILLSMNNVVTSPKQVILLHVQQIVGNAMMLSKQCLRLLEIFHESFRDTDETGEFDLD